MTTVTEIPAADPTTAFAHFAGKLSFETDPADVAYALKAGDADFVLIDTRAKGAYTKSHVPGAVNVPEGGITAAWLAELPADKLLVTYCWGPACNGSTRAAMRIAALGRPVKEMIGGYEYWVREGWRTEGKRPLDARVDTPKPTDLGLFC
ncbi:rhodanese-like domain-containing protein [Longispora fulva]|uniref:Rhodanese-related sulfurtransferase n=1 Tax=Longispora fulva TaxID=619741 RepID=A0A8J7GJX1_9ACTN|nr:rhodanese-like domain-containing protein [Longispora fulva]MBG6137963.1 rhodanese-related sulfurtransferase [Longispora fulva]GIG60216.1 rhodanese-like domain-containing protein [Longispora fulva]